MTWSRIIITTLLLTLVGGLWIATAHAADQDAPIIHTVLPKDAISAILKPEFVTAATAQVEDTAKMIGVVFNQEAHAYSAVLLNGHEIVNDTVGGREIATTW